MSEVQIFKGSESIIHTLSTNDIFTETSIGEIKSAVVEQKLNANLAGDDFIIWYDVVTSTTTPTFRITTTNPVTIGDSDENVIIFTNGNKISFDIKLTSKGAVVPDDLYTGLTVVSHQLLYNNEAVTNVEGSIHLCVNPIDQTELYFVKEEYAYVLLQSEPEVVLGGTVVQVFDGSQDVSVMGTAITANNFSILENIQTAANTIKADPSVSEESMVLYDVSSSTEVRPVFRIAQNSIITTNGTIVIIFTNGKTGQEIPLEITVTLEGAVVPEGFTIVMGDSGPHQLFYYGEPGAVISGETYLCLDPTYPMMLYFVNNETAYKIMPPTANESTANEPTAESVVKPLIPEEFNKIPRRRMPAPTEPTTSIEPLLNEVETIGIYNTPTGTIMVEVGGRIEIH